MDRGILTKNLGTVAVHLPGGLQLRDTTQLDKPYQMEPIKPYLDGGTGAFQLSLDCTFELSPYPDNSILAYSDGAHPEGGFHPMRDESI